MRDVLRMATVAGAEANWLSRKVGNLAVGKQADIVQLQAGSINVLPVNDLAGAVVSGMEVSNVDTVLVAGRVRKRGGKLVGVPKTCNPTTGSPAARSVDVKDKSGEELNARPGTTDLTSIMPRGSMDA